MAFTPLPNMSDEDGFAPGVVPSLVFAFRFEPDTNLLQFRVGDFPDANSGWQAVSGSANPQAFALLAEAAQLAAESARDDAQSAQGLAEAARIAAEAAQGLAEGYRDDAEAAKNAAEAAADAATGAVAGALQADQNLADVDDATTARQNIGAHDADNLTTGTIADARLPTTQTGKAFTTPPTVPSLTETQRDALVSPVDGWIIFNATLNQFEGRANGTWVRLGSLNQAFQ